MPIYEFRCGVCSMSLTVDGSVHGETVAPLCCGQLAIEYGPLQGSSLRALAGGTRGDEELDRLDRY